MDLIIPMPVRGSLTHTSPLANRFVIGTAVINTHSTGTAVINTHTHTVQGGTAVINTHTGSSACRGSALGTAAAAAAKPAAGARRAHRARDTVVGRPAPM